MQNKSKFIFTQRHIFTRSHRAQDINLAQSPGYYSHTEPQSFTEFAQRIILKSNFRVLRVKTP